MSTGASLTVVTFSKQEIVPCDLSGFLAVYGFDTLPKGADLAAMMNSVAFTVVDYDEDPREIFEIPEVRVFYAKLWESWPYWFFFCNLECGEMLALVSCVVPNQIKVTDLGRNTVGVKYQPSAFAQFFDRGTRHAIMVCARAGLSEQQILARIDAVDSFFDIGSPLAATPTVSTVPLEPPNPSGKPDHGRERSGFGLSADGVSPG